MIRTLSQEPAELIVASQRHPRQKSFFWSHSPTESLQSRLAWARRESWLLRAIHQRRRPTFLMTIQWGQVVSPGDFKKIDQKLSRSLREHADRFDRELRFYSVKEIDCRDLVHAHVLVRTDMEQDDLIFLFEDRCRRFSDSKASVTYCEPIRQSTAASLYTTKDLIEVRSGKRKLLLFEPGTVRLRCHMRYWKPGETTQLRQIGRQLWCDEVQRRGLAPGCLPTFDGFTSTLLDRCSLLTIAVDSSAAPRAIGCV